MASWNLILYQVVEVLLLPAKAMSLVDLGKRLLESAKLGETEEVRHLMTNGAPFTTDWLGTSPLHLAAQFGHLNTAEVLIRAGISRDARTKVDRTPLHVSAQEGHVEIVELLLKSGADMEAKDMLKMTPLHWAVERGHVGVIESLLRHGSDVNIPNKFEKSAIDIAEDNGRTDIVEILNYADRFRSEGPIIEGDISCEANKQGKDGDPVPLASQQEEVQTSAEIIKSSPVRPILLHPNIANIKKASSKDSVTDDDSPDQSSTSVLATLAALAEAATPLNAQSSANTSTTDALQWLESHGITMVPADNSTIVASALEGGQTISLTEAGKLALHWTKKQNIITSQIVETAEEESLRNAVSSINTQKVITIVADQDQLPSLVSGSGDGPILVAMSNSDALALTQEQDQNGEPPRKKNKRDKAATVGSESCVMNLDREQLQRRFEEARRKAEAFKEQVRMSEIEAEEYRKKLEAMPEQNAGV
uniref:Uncharacterized protein n=1 Tax=Strigamia maritima TaxID=126957 RepID=T1ISQ5_STRMM